MPNAVLEALGSGLPVILSDINPHVEIFDECKGACRIFKLSDGVSSLVDEFKNVGNIFDNSSKEDARRVANDIFSASVMAKHYEEYYLKVLGRT